MKKKFQKAIIAAMMCATVSTGAFATWYSASVTLPRTGSMKTTARGATSGTQHTKVTNNAYDVYGRIVLNNTDYTPLTDYVNHQDKNNQYYGSIFSHNTGTKAGTSIRAEFKTGSINYFTTTATIHWEP